MTLHPKVQKLKNMLRDKQEYPLLHGRRTKEIPKVIMNKGFCTLTPYEYKQSILNALKYFGKEKIATTNSYKGELVRSILREVNNPDRASIYASTIEDSVCTWAKNNPEHISLVLDYIGIPQEDIKKYLEKTFGTCKKIELKDTFPIAVDINLMKRCLKPEEIKKVTNCEKY